MIEFQERGISEERREKNGLHLPMSDLYHQLRSAPASVLALGAWPLPNRTLDELARGAGSIGCFQGLRVGGGGGAHGASLAPLRCHDLQVVKACG